MKVLNWLPSFLSVIYEHTRFVFSIFETLNGSIKIYFSWLNEKQGEIGPECLWKGP